MRKDKFYMTIKIFVGRIKDFIIIAIQKYRNKINLKRVQKKYMKGEKINIVYYIEEESMWKLEGVYQEFKKDSSFCQKLLVIPVVPYEKDYMDLKMKKTFEYFQKKEYPVYMAYDEKGESLNVDDLDADIIFYSRPYKGSSLDKYYISNNLDKLNCYVNYSYGVLKYDRQIYRSLVANASWKFFLPTHYHYQEYKKLGFTRAKNSVVTGYPGVDKIEYESQNRNRNCYDNNRNFWRVIWAPHHSIERESPFSFSTFLEYYKTFLFIAKQYEDIIQLSFKPHPSLRQKLYKHKDWGREKTDYYYKLWSTGKNTQIYEGQYVELFNSSDLLIHDSASFLAEYLHTGKPAIFLEKGESYKELDDFGKVAYSNHYIVKSESELFKIIEQIIIKNEDYMKTSREKLYFGSLKTKRKSASQEIYHNMISEIKCQKR